MRGRAKQLSPEVDRQVVRRRALEIALGAVSSFTILRFRKAHIASLKLGSSCGRALQDKACIVRVRPCAWSRWPGRKTFVQVAKPGSRYKAF